MSLAMIEVALRSPAPTDNMRRAALEEVQILRDLCESRSNEIVQLRGQLEQTEDARDMADSALSTLRAERDGLLAAEHKLSDAYIRLRTILGAFDTPFAPTAEQVWEHTEHKATELKHLAESRANEIAQLRAEAETKRKAAAILYHYYEEQKALAQEMAEALKTIEAHNHVSPLLSCPCHNLLAQALLNYHTHEQTQVPPAS